MLKFSSKIISVLALSSGMTFSPAVVFAYNCPSGGLCGIFEITMQILKSAVNLLIAFAVVFFLYGITKYITAGEDEDRRTKMKNLMIYGIIGLFVMVSFWGIVNIIMNTFGFQGGEMNIKVPYFESGTSGGGGNGGYYPGETGKGSFPEQDYLDYGGASNFDGDARTPNQ